MQSLIIKYHKKSIALRLRLVYLWLWNLLIPFRCYLDRKDNSVTINRSLYNALLYLGVETNNRISTFTIGESYAFCLYPRELEDGNNYFSRLQHDSLSNCLGWELLNPSVNRIMYDWQVPLEFDTILVNVAPRLIDGTDNAFIYLAYDKRI